MGPAQSHVVVEVGPMSELKTLPLLMGVMNVLGQVQLRRVATLKIARVI